MAAESRFEFGDNWKAFLSTLDDARILRAQESLLELLAVANLEGKTFLDIGSGSGLFSLAAYRLGATVVSIDYDPASVECTRSLRQQYCESSDDWTVLQGSVLDENSLSKLGQFDVVYSWGVLHHTGSMYEAIELAGSRVCPNGLFAIAIYNDQGGASRRWLRIKTIYNRLPRALRPLWVLAVAGIYECKFSLARAARFRNPLPFSDWRAKKLDRGMSAWHDWVDWVGGLPFEVAKPEGIVVPMRSNGWVLENLKTVGNGWGCNEYVFRRSDC